MADQRLLVNTGNSSYLEEVFALYQQNPTGVDPHWRRYFDSLPAEAAPRAVAAGAAVADDQSKVTQLIQAFRNYGHKRAHLNPLNPAPTLDEDLHPSAFGLSANDMGRSFNTDGVLPQERATLKEIFEALKRIYTGSVGVQYYDLPNRAERLWLQGKLEGQAQEVTAPAARKTILDGLVRAAMFEDFLHTKFVGAKRFSLEGGDAYIPMMQALIEASADYGVDEVVLGMAHRGRLNTLVNILHKPLELLFAEFKGALASPGADMGDVKYHMGKSYDVTTSRGKKVHVALLSNPSHLEAVNPVVEGSARARQKRKGKDGVRRVMPVLVHGDAAFIGQGVVPETLNLSQLEGYTTGGTVHVVINNQIGFTALPSETCGTEYCTDFARMLQVPIFHVNSEDPEACVRVMKLAAEYRAAFGRDVVIDLVCYRKYGHNEGDDPTFTQPKMYRVIKEQKAPYENYAARLVASGALSQAEVQGLEKAYEAELQKGFAQAEKMKEAPAPDEFKAGAWKDFKRSANQKIKTAISEKTLSDIEFATLNLPRGFTPHPKVWKLMEARAEMYRKGGELNWGAAEMAAYASLLAEGYNVRISGQDVKRGTFSHRNITLKDVNSGAECLPVASMAQQGAWVEAWNSSLSEEAVLGFEFGHSWADPKTLTVWEAQFGDFANGAQIVIDQFIASSATKWQRYSGLVMLLPHGWEGQGPEHSSARLERYLQLCADGNMDVMNLTTPAQIFHALRQQMLRPFRRPMVVMSPKSLLRHPLAVSKVNELTKGSFMPVIPDEASKAVKRVVLCSGKIYYDALAQREKDKNGSKVALVRLEQLHPLPVTELKAALAPFGKAEVVWLQEEPRNQGAWTYLLDNLVAQEGMAIRPVCRPASSSPAVGQLARHTAEQEQLIQQIFTF